METFILSVLCFISVVASSSAGICPPPPGIEPPCDPVNPPREIRAAKLITPASDCLIGGCPPGKVCCTDYCGGFHCVDSYTGPLMCPAGPGCRHRRRIDPELPTELPQDPIDPGVPCNDDSDCKTGFLCCTVGCLKWCIQGIPAIFPV